MHLLRMLLWTPSTSTNTFVIASQDVPWNRQVPRLPSMTFGSVKFDYNVCTTTVAVYHYFHYGRHVRLRNENDYFHDVP